MALEGVAKNGYFDFEDDAAGDAILDMERRGFPYLSEYGLGFCTRFAFDPRIVSILGELLGHCVLGHWLRYGEYPGHIECFRRGGPRAGQRVMMVHLWAKGSEVRYYAGSHRHELNTVPGRRSLHEIPQAEMDRVGCQPEKKHFSQGGLYATSTCISSPFNVITNGSRVIVDARVGFEILDGYAITFLFATQEVVANWAKIFIPRQDLAGKVAEMSEISERISLNFTFEDEKGTDEKGS